MINDDENKNTLIVNKTEGQLDSTNVKEQMIGLFLRDEISQIREEIRDNPHIHETIKVLQSEGYRSAIGSFWNAVINDLHEKIMHRSLNLFNQEMTMNINNIEDFYTKCNDYQLIEGAFKIGVFNRESYKMLHSCREVRNLFSAHPGGTEPSIIKVTSFISDCVKYVLSIDYPVEIINIDDYVETLRKETYDRNDIAISNAVNDLPEIYKNELINRLFDIYIHPESPSTLISNIEFFSPILWESLEKKIQKQVTKRVDAIINQGEIIKIDKAFQFINKVNGMSYLSHTAKKSKTKPLIEKLKCHLHDWSVENQCVQDLFPFKSLIINECKEDYVSALTHTFIGKIGFSSQFNRNNFYANGAARLIPTMFESFNDDMAEYFMLTLMTSEDLKYLFKYHSKKIGRARVLGEILNKKVSNSFQYSEVLSLLVDADKEEEFLNKITSVNL